MQPAERPPILPYCRVPIVVREPNAAAPAVARQVAELIAAKRPGAVAEHVGSSAVPGLAGKGTVDLLLPTPPEEIPAVTDDLLALGFQRQAVATAFPPTRPMLQGSSATGTPRSGSTCTWCRPPAPRWRPCAASATPCSPTRPARGVRAAQAGHRRRGTVDSVAFSKAKHAWIVAALERLGLVENAEEAEQGGFF